MRDVRETMEQSIERQQSPTPDTVDAEESVRTLVNRLENGTIPQKCVPRIIESKCIEKMPDAIKPSLMNDSDQLPPTSPPVLINNQSIDVTKANQRQRLPPVDLITQVTVNNHINFNASPIEDVIHHQRLTNGHVNKAKPPKSSPAVKQLSSTAGERQTVTIVKSNKKNVSKTTFENVMKNEKKMQEQPVKTDSNGTDEQTQMDTADRQLIGEPLAPRLIKWNTLSRFDEKNYVTNDAKLKQKPKYDDIEFEEFEVYDPNHECYDSLNGK